MKAQHTQTATLQRRRFPCAGDTSSRQRHGPETPNPNATNRYDLLLRREGEALESLFTAILTLL